VKDEHPSRCSTNAFSSCRSRGARASAQVLVCTRSLRSGSGFAPTTSRPFGSRTSPRSGFDLAADRVPARSYRRSLPTTSLVSGRSRRARSPPPRVSLPRRRPTCLVGAPGARGCGPAATPVLSTDVCSSRILFSKTIASKSRHTSHRLFPHDARARGFTPQRPLRRAAGRRQGVVSLGFRSRRRTSDAPSPAGSPGGTMSTGVGPRSACDLRSKPVGLGPLHQAA
jgi:hypothetical protein